MKFTYTAKNQRGELQSGIVEAGSRDGAVATLQGYGLVVLRLQEEVILPWYLRFFGGISRVSMKEMAIFTRQFATLLEAQVPLVDALRTMFQQTQNVFLKEATFDVISDVESGAALSQAFSRHEGIFSHFYVQMVKSAEVTGRLQEVFEYLAAYFESQATLSAKIKSAMIYPVFVLALFVIVVAVMVTTVIPQLSRILLETGVELSTLPLASQFLFKLGNFFQNYLWVVLVVVLFSVWLLRFYFKSEEGRALLEVTILSFPIIGAIARQVYLARFAETVSVMISGDIPVAQSLEVGGDVVGNISYQEAVQEVANSVRRGELISEALSRFPDKFPPLIVQMIAIGEKTGRIDQLLARAAKFYAKEVEQSLSNITELLQPILIVILGIFVGLLIGSVILPIYQIAQTF